MSMVLVVDDKELMRDSVGATLQRAGMSVVGASDGKGALEMIARRRPDVIVTDQKMPGMGGVELLEQVRQIHDDVPVIMMTAFGAVDTAVKAMKLGAFDYLTKPFEGDELIIAVKRAIEHGRLLRENAVLRRGGGTPAAGEDSQGSVPEQGEPARSGMDRIIGDSAAMRRVREQVMAVAESHGTVLVYGESGTGKEVVARAIHELSPRSGEAYLAVNCAALSESLLESELFGHEKGAFTGAEKLRKGRFELADRGSLLLDEISEVSTRVQAKLLRVLQERTLERVGSSMSIGVDVRVIATSNRNLPQTVARGEFRQDLFFRLNVLPIHLPPLRDRIEDVPALAEHFVQVVAAREGKAAKRFSPGALVVLAAYSWPGNVRELQNICERASVLCRGEVISGELIEPWLLASVEGDTVTNASARNPGTGSARMPPPPAPLPHLAPPPYSTMATVYPGMSGSGMSGSFGGLVVETKPGSVFGAGGEVRPLEEIERDAIVATLKRYKGHRQKAALALGIGVRTLGLKLKKWKSENLVEQTL
ncbi:MAG: sigma-54-dependent Fis family transcriptional regulator [Phycisphaerales bacterium]|nr:sigma-54-dependent Fis family transcriptional regulator [Phycisphaerales bacterium]